jgi:hypothetical protein
MTTGSALRCSRNPFHAGGSFCGFGIYGKCEIPLILRLVDGRIRRGVDNHVGNNLVKLIGNRFWSRKIGAYSALHHHNTLPGQPRHERSADLAGDPGQKNAH